MSARVIGGVIEHAVEPEMADAPGGIVVYRVGRNRNNLGLSPKALSRVARTYERQPVLYGHDHDQIIGVIERSRARDGKAIVQTIQLDEEHPLVQQMSKLGLRRQYSVSWMSTADTVIECSVCGGDLRGDACNHWPGQTYDGQVCQGVYTDAVGVETSVTWAPAVDGTGVAYERELTLSAESHARLIDDLVRLRTARGGKSMAESQVEAVKAAEETPAAPDPAPVEQSAPVDSRVDEVAELRALLAQERHERLVEQSKHVVLEWRRDGRLIGDVDQAVQLRAKNPSVIDEWMRLIPRNPTLATGRLVGTPGAAPEAPKQGESIYAQVARRTAERCKAEGVTDAAGKQRIHNEELKRAGGES